MYNCIYNSRQISFYPSVATSRDLSHRVLKLLFIQFVCSSVKHFNATSRTPFNAMLSQDSIRAPIKLRRLRAKVQSSSEHNVDGSGPGNTRRRNFLLSTGLLLYIQMYTYLQLVISNLSPLAAAQ